MIKQIGLPLRGSLILVITRMITDRIGLHSVLIPLSTGCLGPLASMVILGSQYSNFTFNTFTVVLCEYKKKIVVAP